MEQHLGQLSHGEDVTGPKNSSMWVPARRRGRTQQALAIAEHGHLSVSDPRVVPACVGLDISSLPTIILRQERQCRLTFWLAVTPVCSSPRGTPWPTRAGPSPGLPGRRRPGRCLGPLVCPTHP